MQTEFQISNEQSFVTPPHAGLLTSWPDLGMLWIRQARDKLLFTMRAVKLSRKCSNEWLVTRNVYSMQSNTCYTFFTVTVGRMWSSHSRHVFALHALSVWKIWYTFSLIPFSCKKKRLSDNFGAATTEQSQWLRCTEAKNGVNLILSLSLKQCSLYISLHPSIGHTFPTTTQKNSFAH